MTEKQTYRQVTKELTHQQEEEFKNKSVELIRLWNQLENEKAEFTRVKGAEIKEAKIEMAYLAGILDAGKITEQVLCIVEYDRAHGQIKYLDANTRELVDVATIAGRENQIDLSEVGREFNGGKTADQMFEEQIGA